MGDVSGKGVSAALVASVLQGILYSQLTDGSSLTEAVESVNRFFCSRGSGRYATVIVSRLYPDGHLEFVNCGHVAPFLISGESVTQLEIEGSLPLGLVPEAKYDNGSKLILQPGDRFLVVTDGVLEAYNAHEEMFGLERLTKSSTAGVKSIEQALNTFVGETSRAVDQQGPKPCGGIRQTAQCPGIVNH